MTAARFRACVRFTTLAVSVGVGAAASACWVPKATGQAMRRDIRKLADGIEETRATIDDQQAQAAEQIKRADESLNSVDKKLQQLNRAARQTDAGFGVRLDEQQREMQELRGQNELLTYRLSQLEQQLEAVAELQKRVDTLETSMPNADEAEPPTQPAKKPPAEAPKDKKGLLAFGKRLVKEGKLDEARGVFRQLIDKFPKELGYADEAYFQIGESYFKGKKYRPALQEYIHVVESFAKGKLVDDAYYRIGLCSMELGNLEDALIFFDEIIKNHKKSPLVKSAKKKQREVQKRLEKEKKKKK